MLKVFGSFYANTKEDFEAIKKAVEDGGFTVAYNNETSGTVLKDVQSLEDNTDEQ